jgi:hypothetical protein
MFVENLNLKKNKFILEVADTNKNQIINRSRNTTIRSKNRLYFRLTTCQNNLASVPSILNVMPKKVAYKKIYLL